MARAKGTPVRVPGQEGLISTTSQLSREYVSSSSSSSSLSSSSSSSGSEAADSDSHPDIDDSSGSDGSNSRDSSDIDTTRQDAAAVLPQIRRAYEPPQGFQPLSTDPSASRASKLLDPTNLAGKQLWHITAPASVPVSTLKEVSTQKVMNGEAVLSHNGSEYGFAALDEVAAGSNQTMLLVPAEKGYQPVGATFTQTLHLRQVINLPILMETTTSIEAAPQVPSTPAFSRKAIRKQPEGLRMRFMPIGVDSSKAAEIGWSSSTDVGETEGADIIGDGTKERNFCFPNGFTKDHRLGKRKHESTNGAIGEAITAEAELSPRKKKSKRNHEHESLSATEPTSVSPSKDHSIRGRTKELPKSHTNSLESSTVAGQDSSCRRPETSRERARRKEKERRRRERAEKTQHDKHRHSHHQHQGRSPSTLK
ncbi:hypothetical protein FGG08_005849 [Glutinoglossum americanum]|uniref:Uncharacterized protein n=1 Tax=Glutinoglossum americanum TaxID=1670608 RepID=A0A9P8L1G5_9PEZI|nr:hypothetical protein FGG08_005849 [Glutinoglossum americanum]